MDLVVLVLVDFIQLLQINVLNVHKIRIGMVLVVQILH